MSLTETVIALCLIAVLAVITISGTRQLSNRNKAVRNLSHLRQIAAALIAYAYEHEGRLPPNSRQGSSGGYETFYTRELAAGGYVSDGTIFFSPWGAPWWASPPARLRALHNPALQSSLPWSSPAYGANSEGAMPNSPSSTGAKRPAHLGQVAAAGHASRLMLLRDVYNPNASDRGGGMIRFSGGSSSYIPLPQHRGGYEFIHAAFADGHVQAFTRAEVDEFEQNSVGAPYFIKVHTR